jgi:hypothetical protein
VGHAADLIGDWARSFLPEAGGQPAIYPLLLFLRYESLIVLMGLIEAGRAVVSRRADPWWTAQPGSLFPHTRFLVFWAIVATLIVLISGHRPAGNTLLVVVPLTLLAGQGMERAWRWVADRALWSGAILVSAVALGMLVFFYLQVAAYSQASGTSTVMVGPIALYTTSTYLLLASVAPVLLLGLGAVVWLWRGPELVVAGGWLTAVVVLGLFGFRAAWSTSISHASDARELMIMQTTDPDVRLLVEGAEALSLAKARDAHTLAITVDATTGPVVAWYLREFKNLAIVEGLSTPPDTMAAVTLAVEDPPIGETFRGQGFSLRSHWLPWGLWGQDLVRWLLFTEGSLPVVDQEVVLWVASQP